MATGGQEEISQVDFPELIGSEAVFVHVCQPCSAEMTKEGVGFCVDCLEWLCDECFRFHKRTKPTRHHVMKNLEEMKKSATSVERVDKCTEKCDSHSGKKLKYFCPVHDILGCSMCIFQNHRTCKIQHIPDVSKDVDTMNEFQQITAKLYTVTIAAREIVTDLNNQVELVTENKTDMTNAFRKYGKQLHEAIDTTIFALEEQCEKTEKREKAKLKVMTERCDTNEKESSIMKSQLEIFEQSGQHCNMFVAMKRAKRKLESIESIIKQDKCSSIINLSEFWPNRDVETILNSSGGIGTVVEIGEPCFGWQGQLSPPKVLQGHKPQSPTREWQRQGPPPPSNRGPPWKGQVAPPVIRAPPHRMQQPLHQPPQVWQGQRLPPHECQVQPPRSRAPPGWHRQGSPLEEWQGQRLPSQGRRLPP